MTSDSALNTLFKDERSIFLEMLGSFTLVDIGMIESINDQGRAVVLTNQYVAGQRVIYKDAEVIYPGNKSSAYVADCSGSACLILFPYTCMPNTSNKLIRPSMPPYHKDGVKVMPVGNGSNPVVRQTISTSGAYSIGTTEYDILFDKETISLTQGDVLALSKDAAGNINIRHKGEDTGAFSFSLGDDGIHKSYSSKDGDVVWEDAISTDGTRTFTQVNGNGDELSSVTIDPDGTITVQSVKDIVANTDGDIKLNGDASHLVKYEELEQAMQKLYTALTTTPIAGNGSTQPTWSGITSIDISASKADNLTTGE